MVDTPPGNHEPSSDDREYLSTKFVGFMEHLEELRHRILRALLILAAGTAACLLFSEQLINFLTNSFQSQDNTSLALLYPTEGFVVRLKIAFVAGLFLTSPLWFIQLWGFVSPGLYKREKKVVAPVILGSSTAFLLGAAFGYWILPHAVAYFQSLTTQDVAVSWSLGRYVDFSLRLLIAFGLVFELPLVMYAAASLGIVTPKTLRRYRRHAVIAVLVAAALITPPDLFTQIILAIPLILLYEVGIFMAVIAQRRIKRKSVNP